MSIWPGRWKWRHVKSLKWKHSEHINILEARMFLFTVKWRARAVHYHSRRFLHLLDSQVGVAVFTKGRSSSRSLNQVLRKTAAALVASDQYFLLAYVGTKENPADEASRRYDEPKNRSSC